MGELGAALSVVLFSPCSVRVVRDRRVPGYHRRRDPGSHRRNADSRLTLPLTFYMEPVNAIILLVAMYVGAISGGLITATLVAYARHAGGGDDHLRRLSHGPWPGYGRVGRWASVSPHPSWAGIVSWIALYTLAEPLSIGRDPFRTVRVLQSDRDGDGADRIGQRGFHDSRALISGLLGMLVSMPRGGPIRGSAASHLGLLPCSTAD